MMSGLNASSMVASVASESFTIGAGYVVSMGTATVVGAIGAGYVAATGTDTVAGDIGAGYVVAAGTVVVTGDIGAGYVNSAGGWVTVAIGAGNISTVLIRLRLSSAATFRRICFLRIDVPSKEFLYFERS